MAKFQMTYILYLSQRDFIGQFGPSLWYASLRILELSFLNYYFTLKLPLGYIFNYAFNPTFGFVLF